MKLNAKELRVSEPKKADIAKIKRRPIYIVCDNILDTYNIGSIFRLADAVAVSKIYLCGQSETPPNIKIKRASVGTDKWVPWEYKKSAVEAIKELRRTCPTPFVIPAKVGIRKKKILDQVEDDKSREIKVVAIEQHPKAKDFRNINYQPSTMNHEPALAFVIGHETDGVSKEALALCDEIVEIPMFGVNKSLNVMVSLAIVLFR